MERCSIEILDASLIDIAIDTSLPRTSMTMKIENEIEEDSGNGKTWSADLSEEHFEEVKLNEIVLQVYAIDGESDENGGGDTLVTEMQLSEQSSTSTDQCYQWTLSWSDNDNDGYTSAGDAYSISRTEKVIDPCADDDEYRNKNFQIMFYDHGLECLLVEFSHQDLDYSTISCILASSVIIGRRVDYLTLEPDRISPSVVRTLTPPSPSSAASIIPSDITPLSFLGSRLATNTTFRPSNSDGS